MMRMPSSTAARHRGQATRTQPAASIALDMTPQNNPVALTQTVEPLPPAITIIYCGSSKPENPIALPANRGRVQETCTREAGALK